jgi:hypothetical protein
MIVGTPLLDGDPMRAARLFLLPILAVLSLSAQESAFSGVWKHVSNTGIEAAIEEAVKDMNFIKRPIARGRLKDTNPAYQKVAMTTGAQEISIQYDARNPIKTPANGTAVPWTREDGKTFQVTAKVEGNRLVQTFKNDEGERTNVWQVGADGKLTLAVTVKSGSLPKPLTYSISFGR